MKDKIIKKPKNIFTREEVKALLLTFAAFPKPMTIEQFDTWFSYK